MTTIRTVERIDATRGPNLEQMLRPWLMLNSSSEGPPGNRIMEIAVRFDEVAYFDDDGVRFDKRRMGETLRPYLMGIEPVGRKLENVRNGDFVVTLYALDATYRGHYNTYTRKGSFTRLRDHLEQ